jgi:myo-inositol-1(or 4)-monophosphatase
LQVGSAVSVGLKSSPTDVVTQTDIDAERLIRQILLGATPRAGIIGEEGGERVTTSRLQWIIDPLDGTVNFTYGIPLLAVSVAAALDGAIVAGAVIDVIPGEVFSATLDGGARRNGAAVGVSNCSTLEAAMVMTGFSYRSELRSIQGDVVRDLLPLVRDIRCFGSAALEMCWVGCGRIDAYYERDTKLWDYAAGALIAREGGAHVELPCPENDGLTAAAPPALFPLLRALVDHPVPGVRRQAQ